MHYAILCYNDEKRVWSWPKEEEEATMARLGAVVEGLARRGKLGPTARLMPTTAATTLRKDRDPPLVIDGPFAETKEQLLGFYIVDCTDLEDALDVAKELGRANPGGTYEIRPLLAFHPAPVLESEGAAATASAR
ncbi:MAG TPA: YciI family protein [Caulobacteraceae bacterium]|nr:YciI family protein [Caulobacteraceae bacterium]